MVTDHDQRLIDLLDTVVGTLGTILHPVPRPLGNHEWLVVEAGAYANGPALRYGTLSNRWFGAYQLMSLMFGLTRWSVSALVQTTDTIDYVSEIMSAVKLTDVHRAITTGDQALARANWAKIEPLLVIGMSNEDYFGSYPLSPKHLAAFHHFLSKPVDQWFGHDVLTHWTTLPEAHSCGWETFLSKTVTDDMLKTRTGI